MLTPEQQEIVYCNHRHFKVLSAAGSGKTTVLTERISQICTNVPDDANGILAITFTRRAGKELQKRLPREISGQATVGTFHAVILKVMQDNGMDANILSEDEADQLVDECCAKLGHRVNGKYKKHSRAYYKKEIRAARQGGQATPLSQMYQSSLKINGDIDFDGILVAGIGMVQRGMFNWVKHLFVDETQDNEMLQWQFVFEIGKFASVMVVGDIGQSLYSWRGAVPELFDKLDWPTLEMSESFRFPSNIADVANRIGATPLKVRSNKPDGVIGVHRNDYLPDFIKWILTFREPQEIAILCRYNEQVEQVRMDLMRDGVSVVVPSIQWRGPLHDFLVYCTSLSSRTARERVTASWRDARPVIVSYIASQLDNAGVAALVRDWLSMIRAKPCVKDVLRAIVTSMPQSMEPEWKYIMNEYGELSLEQYKAETSEQEWIAEGSGITVGTVHWSKGGEWPVVVIPGLDENRWPRNKITPEELRVLYVAATRAMDEIYVTHGSKPSSFVEFFK